MRTWEFYQDPRVEDTCMHEDGRNDEILTAVVKVLLTRTGTKFYDLSASN